MSRKSLWIVIALVVIVGAAVGFKFYFHKAPPQQVVTQAITPPQPIHDVIGTSVEGRDIDAYTYGTGSTTLLFVGGMHGGYEWNSVLLAYQYMDYLKAHPETIPASLRIAVIPSINPDGVFKVIGKEGRFTLADIPTKKFPAGTGRFNAHDVDLNRNFGCNWKPTSSWQNKTVSAGTAAFSEPEAQALKNFVEKSKPAAAIFWHSQANAVYASQCNGKPLPATLDIMKAYAHAAGYPAVASFDAYPITGDSEGWLASIGVPAITVEMKTHESVDWEKNLAGVNALIEYFSKKSPQQ